jgi:hypothetical protein
MQRTIVTTHAGTLGSSARIRWGAVLAGGVLSVALMLLASSLWLALGYGSGVDFVARDLRWFIGGTVVASLLIGGFTAARLSGLHGLGAGLAHGLTLWALVLLVALSVGVPSIFNVLSLGRISSVAQSGGVSAQGVISSLWATFVSLAAAFVAAAVGGLLGGLTVPKTADRATVIPDDAGFSSPTSAGVKVLEREQDPLLSGRS